MPVRWEWSGKGLILAEEKEHNVKSTPTSFEMNFQNPAFY
jgi:hypothetical protein